MPFTADDVRRVLGEGEKAPLDPVSKHASVAAIVLPDTSLLFIKRAEKATDPWSGHVAFPGGRLEPEDDGPRGAAIRETLEEVGVDLRGATYLGALPALNPISGMGLLVHPFAWSLAEEPVLRPNYEVGSVHRLGLDALIDGVGRREFDFQWAGKSHVLPCVDFDGVRLWGLTLRVVDEILNRLDGRGVGMERPRRG